MQPAPSDLNARSQRVRAAASLVRRSARQRSGRYLVEGPGAVRELLIYAPQLTEDIFVTADFLARYAHGDLPGLLRASPAHVHIVDPGVVDQIADAENPSGVLAVARPESRSLNDEVARVTGFGVVLFQVRDPGNLGTVVRGADAAGAQLVVVTDSSVDLTNPKVVRSAVGSIHHLPIVTGVALTEVHRVAVDHGVRLIAADGQAATTLPEADLSGPHLWVMGNEARGLAAEDAREWDAEVAVPLYGAAESLNLAMAATVCLYASAMAQRGH